MSDSASSITPAAVPAETAAGPALPHLIMLLLMQGASLGCAMAALGLVLYAGGPSAEAAARLFAAVGFFAGLLCGGLQLVWAGRRAPAARPLPPEALAALLRQTLASAAAGRSALPQRAGSADRRAADRAVGGDPTAPQPFSASVFGA